MITYPHPSLAHPLGISSMRRLGPLKIADEAYEGWKSFCRQQGVTITALVWALGLELSEADGKQLGNTLKSAVARARVITAERRDRSLP